jgi:geranylgeranyl reductase family protein
MLYDAIIVGAGPAGCALAIRLARSGLHVLLLEGGRFPRDKVCGDLVSAKALRHLDDLGCLEEVTRLPLTPIGGATVYLNGHPLAHGTVPQLPGLPPHGHAVPRVALDEILFRRAQRAGAETREDCRVHGVEVAHGRVRVAARVGGETVYSTGQIVVGADGVQSVVAAAAGLGMEDARYVVPAMRAYCRGPVLGEAILYLDEEFFPGYGWVFPVHGEHSNVGVGMVKEALVRRGLRLRAFQGRLERFVARLGREQGRPATFGPAVGWCIKTYGGARRNFFDHGLLIGDAGCFVDPISGEGIPLAFETARLAADTIEEALRRGDCSAAALAAYEQRWRSRWDADLGLADLVVALTRNRHLGALWTRAFRVMGMTAGGDADYARTLGGIMAGLLPARDALSVDVLLRSMLHGPDFWLRALGMGAGGSWAELVAGGLRFARWPAEVVRDSMDDLEWTTAWLAEVRQKWLAVARDVALPSS